MDYISILVLMILFVATFIRSTFGFGEALVAVPLLALVIPVETAAPVAVLVSITVAGIVLLQDWKEIHFHSAGRLVTATLVGTPVGLYLLTTIAGPAIKLILGVVIISFSAWALFSRKRLLLKDDSKAWFYGFTAGVLGGTYGMNGPPLVIYGTLRGWSPPIFRATLQGYFFPASIAIMTGYWLAGLWTPSVTTYYLLTLPVALIAIFLGRTVNLRMNSRTFLAYIHTGLIIVGVILLYQSLA